MKTKIWSYLLLVALLFSCRKESSTDISHPSTIASPQETLALDKVKDWYNHQADSAVTLNTQSVGQRTFHLSNLNPNWTKAESFNGKKNNYWLIHLDGQPKFQNVKQGYRKMAFIRDSTGQIQARILEIIPDVIYYQRKQKAETSDFTGRVFIYDAGYHLLGGKVYSQGKQIGRIKPQTASVNTSKIRTLMVQVSEDCEWYDSNYIDGEGVFTVYSENICTYSIYDDGFYPDMGGGGGGAPVGDPMGGGGGGGGDAASAPEVANLPGEDHPKINPKSYLDCFGSVPNTNVSMKVTVYVQEPFPGTTFNYGPNSVGHTAIGITKSGGGQTVTQVVGFYPDASGKDKMHAPGKLVDNTQLDYNVSITYNVDAVQFANLVNYLNSPLPAYDITDMNCTGYAFNACAYAGINLPDPYTTVGLPTPNHIPNMAMTPAGLGNSIQNMQGQPGVNTNGGTGPTTHGPCN